MDDPGSFWAHDDPGGDPQSSLEKLLNEPSPDLEAILDNEETIQECKFFNEPLTDFLSKRDVLEKLIRYTVDIPKDALQRTAKRYPYVASELFACEVASMLQGVFNDETLLDTLFEFVKREEVPDPRHTGYFRKVVGVLIQKNFSELEGYMKKHPDILIAMAKKVSLFGIMELIIMLGWDVTIEGNRDTSWIAESDFMSTLLDQLDSKSASEDASENVATALISLTETCGVGMEPGALLEQLESKEFTKRLCDYAVKSSPKHASINAMKILIAVVSRLTADTESKEAGVQPAIHNVVTLVVPHSAALLSKVDSKTEAPLPLQYGTLAPPFGMLRLQHMRLLSALLYKPIDIVMSSYAEHKIPKIILDLMLKFPFNNLLHNLIREFVSSVINFGPCDLFLSTLIKDAKLPQIILEGFATHEKKAENNKANRMGYTGHLICMANALEDSANLNSDVKKALAGVKGWENFVKTSLDVENKNQDTTLGGRKPQTHLQDSDEDDIDETMGRVGMNFSPREDEGDKEDNSDPFADAFDPEWEAQAAQGEGSAARMEFEEAADGKFGSGEEFDDPFGDSTANAVKEASPNEKEEDAFADFDAEFETPETQEVSKSEGKKENPSKAAEPTQNNKANSNELADEFEDFDAEFADA